MKKQVTILSVAALVAGSVLAQQATSNDNNNGREGVPGVEMNVGDNASDRGLPGVEMNVGRDADTRDDTRAMGAGAGTDSGTIDRDTDNSLDQPMRADRG